MNSSNSENNNNNNNNNNDIQNENPSNNENNQVNQILIGPYRVLPGRLSVSRTIGDVEAKLVQFGGNPQVIIPLPDVFIYDLQKDDIDFIILGCDGIYDQLSNEEILDSGWTIFSNEEIGKDINEKCGILVDFILKASMARKSFDNVTCVVIALKDIKEMNSEKNIKIKRFKKEVIENSNLNEDEININNKIKSIIPKIQKKIV
jgi:protein phosphatase 2C family protein 2/3